MTNSHKLMGLESWIPSPLSDLSEARETIFLDLSIFAREVTQS